MFKSTKVLPVMIMGAFILDLRKKYPFHEYISTLLLVVGLILFTSAWSFCSQHPYIYYVLVFEAMATFISQVFVLSLIVIFSVATIAMTTTARKAVILLLLYMIFTKPLIERHGSGLLLISICIILKMFPDTKPSPRVQG
ncbi:hypothetical protein CXB51_007772 [Gossypium anomalum]|uniref:Uncharacterized protein n=1 Tax=Gossypium anomalum TaxID=47600 RepID=A0A8J5ZCF6_9ROSI|nr:hypothetical protein CXB51_007772 [Gossypium anomalum]